MKKKKTIKNKKKSLEHVGKNIHFEVVEFANYNKGIIWYAGAFLIFLILILGAASIQDWRLLAIIILAAIVIYQLAMVNPQRVSVTLSHAGIEYRGKLYPWNVFKSFSTFGDRHHKTIQLDYLKYWKAPLVVPLPQRSQTKKQKSHFESNVFIGFVQSILPERLHGHPTLGDWVTKTTKF